MNLQLVFPADKSGIMFIVKGQPAPLPFVGVQPRSFENRLQNTCIQLRH